MYVENIFKVSQPSPAIVWSIQKEIPSNMKFDNIAVYFRVTKTCHSLRFDKVFHFV